MVFTGSIPPTRGQRERRQVRLTFFRIDPNTVRQFSEVTADGGTTWQVNYDLIYTRRQPPAGRWGAVPARDRSFCVQGTGALGCLSP